MERDRWTKGTERIDIGEMDRREHVFTYTVLTFFVKMFCIAKVKVANNALTSPTRSKDNSVAVATITPPTTGINEQLT